MRFLTSGLSAPLLDAIATIGYSTPTPIQQQAIPAILAGKDVMAAAQTGTGKTAGFALPILERLASGPQVKPNQARALIMVPTRELAVQVGESFKSYGRNLPLRTAVVYGGVKINPQMMRLRRGVDILVATPGRLLDLYSQNAIRFNPLEVLVLDEADRMLDLGFIHEIRRIIGLLPPQHQTLLFSATFSDTIRKLASKLLTQPVEISVGPRNTTVKQVDQWICPVDKKKKALLLDYLIHENHWGQVLVFVKTRQGADRLTTFLLNKGVNTAAIHGDKSQGSRSKALADFKAGATRILVATDIAARGLDINLLPHVVNFDLPMVAQDYVHRTGRTARAGAVGQAISLVSADEIEQLEAIESVIGQRLPRKLIDGFEPRHSVPESRQPCTPPRPKKPKKAKEGKRADSRVPRGQSFTKPTPPARTSRPAHANRSAATTHPAGSPPSARSRRPRPPLSTPS